MKFSLTSKLRLAAAAALLTAGAGVASADVLLQEDFNYPAGTQIYGKGWITHGTQANNPIKTVESSLSYPGYRDVADGSAVELLGGTEMQNQRLQRLIATTVGQYTSGSYYVAFLVKVNSAGTNQYFFNLMGATSSALPADGKTNGSEVGKVFITKGDTDGKFKFGIGKTAASPKAELLTGEYNIGDTFLIVLKHTLGEGSNDTFSIWVNPTQLNAEGTAMLTDNGSGNMNATGGFAGIKLHQGGSSTKPAANVIIDAITVATSWSDLFGENGGGDQPDPGPVEGGELTIAESSIVFDAIYTGQKATKTFTLQGKDLTGDVTLSVQAPFSVTPSTVSAADAEAGAEITVTYSPATGGNHEATLTATSGTATATTNLSGSAVEVKVLPMSTQIVNLTPDDGTVYNYTNKAVITYISGNRAYAQDMVGALCFDFSFFDAVPMKVGDQVTKVYGMISCMDEDGVPYFVVINPDYTTSATGKTKEPLTVSASELLVNPDTYIHRLVTIEDITLNPTEGQKFGTAIVNGTSGDTAVGIRPFAATDVVGSDVPSRCTSVTGISASMNKVIVRPRNLADIEAVAEAESSIEASVEKLFTDTYADIRATEPVAFARFTFTYKNLEKPATIYLTGTNRNMFSIDNEEIPAGSGEAVVTVSYKPTSIGIHKANILVDAVPVEISQSYAISASAIDSQNPPTVTVDGSVLDAEFSAAIGEKEVRTVVATTANMPDYGTVRIIDASGAFQLNSGSLMKSGNTNVTVTFAPKAAGTYTDKLSFEAPGGNTVVFTLKGTATGSAPVEDVEGDELDFDTSAPLATMIETMESAVSNKPLSINGWKNVAMEGTRAWWGYEVDGNPAAKVTAYDSKATGNPVPASMLLMTPALDYVNAPERLFTCRVMGQYLSENQTDQLHIVLIDATELPAYTQSLGIATPSTSDYNNQWQEYVVDLDGLDIPDTFFLGFYFISERGRDNVAVYYVDDVTWGRNDIPFIRPEEKIHEFLYEPNKDYSRSFNVKGLNLSEPIQLKMVGSHAGKFTLSHTEIPAEGGEFTVNFNSDLDEHHTAYVEMKSGNAPISYIELHGNAKMQSGIDDITAGDNVMKVDDGVLSLGAATTVRVYSTLGQLVAASDAPVSSISLRHLAPGIYVVNTGNGTAIKISLR